MCVFADVELSYSDIKVLHACWCGEGIRHSACVLARSCGADTHAFQGTGLLIMLGGRVTQVHRIFFAHSGIAYHDEWPCVHMSVGCGSRRALGD